MASVYDHEIGNELTRGSKKPIRDSFPSLYLQWLHFQFLGVAIVLIGLAYIWFVRGEGIFSVEFFIFALVMPFAVRFLVIPCFHILKGHLPPKKRLIVSLSFSGIILAAMLSPLFFIWGDDAYSFIQEKIASASKRSPHSSTIPSPSANDFSEKSSPPIAMVSEIEFRLVPYARVFDASDEGSSPIFLLESHLKTVRLDRGGEYLFRFHYMGNVYTQKIEITSPGNYVLFFDMRSGQFWFRSKGGL
jgi:hypothetical protein